ncbi:unnamed protein product [Spirodela intermedia]|uniref:Uncharacterized protein n=1 Tax=Spirodela intermedia TaxID=51605 RepID=A0A7I8IVJ1_SPIIN|nr:unnamed protein product [Spirodela intermedia]CAA6661158.1 unnamed protein product [Spirodela intermedia]
MKIVLLIVFLLRSSGSRLRTALSPDGLTLLGFKSAVSRGPSSVSLAGWEFSISYLKEKIIEIIKIIKKILKFARKSRLSFFQYLVSCFINKWVR